jgi:O-acetyl-ADP-ribose deacetylase (regulator of RNase III)
MSVQVMRPLLSVVLVDVNARVTRAWEAAFANLPEVTVVRDSILTQAVDAWVTPTNARGHMDGGVDYTIKEFLGDGIEQSVQQEIALNFGGSMPVGAATCVPTGLGRPGYLISVPTMTRSAENIRATVNVALACAAAFQAIHEQNRRRPGSIRSVALPGLGAGTGSLSPRQCANLMLTGYTLFNDHQFADFADLRRVLLEHLDETEDRAAKTRVRRAVATRSLVTPPHVSQPPPRPALRDTRFAPHPAPAARTVPGATGAAVRHVRAPRRGRRRGHRP